jgi:hypothetical protein
MRFTTRKVERHASPTGLLVVQAQFAAQLVHEATHRRQAQSRPVVTQRSKGAHTDLQ